LIAALATGFGAGFSLILAIGAQNAFVLRQGLIRAHVFAICLTCALSDAVLIAAGVAGFGAAADALPWLESVMRHGGAAFLVFYGMRRLIEARAGRSLPASGAAAGGLRRALATCLALTWLNPHVYMDTLALLGALAAPWPEPARWAFGAGATLASFTFFFGLGYGARLLAPLFARPRAWAVLDIGVAMLMFGIATRLVIG